MPAHRFRAAALAGPALMLIGLAAVAAAGATVTHADETDGVRAVLADAGVMARAER
jgi:hypothetical protein